MSEQHGHKKGPGEDWRPEDIKEILETVSEKIPQLLESLGDVLYSKDNATKYADAIASFYKSLVEAGMSQEQAFELTQKYMSSLSPLSAMGGVFKGHLHDND